MPSVAAPREKACIEDVRTRSCRRVIVVSIDV
jgi:hypothetical protein